MANQAEERSKNPALLVWVPPVMSLLMLVVGWRRTEAWGGRPAVEAMILAQILLLAVVYVSILPIFRQLAQADPLNRLKLTMRAGGIRFLLTLAGVAVILGGGWAERRPFLLWIGIGYVVMTLAETLALARWLRKSGNSA